MLDAVASRFEIQGGYLAGMEVRMPDPAERAETYLKLFAASVFTQGALARKARRALLATLAMPDFPHSMRERRGKPRQAAMMELVGQLEDDRHPAGRKPAGDVAGLSLSRDPGQRRGYRRPVRQAVPARRNDRLR